MNAKTDKFTKKNYFIEFPKNRNFYFLGSYAKIKDFENSNFEDPEYICVITENEHNNVKENLYKRCDFIQDFEFIRVIEKDTNIELNFIASKENINIGGSDIRLLTLIKNRPLIMKEIKRNTKINFNTKKNIIFKPLFSVPLELKFFNKVFILYILDQNFQNNQSTINNKGINTFNNNNNFGFNNNTNNANTIQFRNNNGCNTFGHNNANNNNFYNLNPLTQNIILNNNNFNNNQLNPQTFQNNNNFNLNNSNYSNNNNNFQFNNNEFIRHDYDQYIFINNNNQKGNNNQKHYNTSIPNNSFNNQNPNYNFDNTNINQCNNNMKKTDNTEKNSTQINQNQNYLRNGENNYQDGIPSQSQTNTYQQYPPQQPGANVSQQSGNNPPQQPGTNVPQQPGNNPPQQPGNNPPQQPGDNTSQKPGTKSQIIQNYIFSKKGLKNIGSTCYMNATLQCLLHVSELTVYFIDEYPKDQQNLLKINKNVQSGGNISRAFFNLVIGVNENSGYLKSKNNPKPKTNKKGFNILGFLGFDDDSNDSLYDKAFAPTEFKKVLGQYNPQFKRFEANDSKDLILYLLQTMHEELNYCGNQNIRLKYAPNQFNIYETYTHFTTNYNTTNFSKISLLFYGTYINTTTCVVCKNILYNFQKFEFISFGMFYYNRKRFNILDGFKDNSSSNMLKGDNKFLCNYCNKLQEAETACKIFEPPQKLLINIDYGKNKKYQPSMIEFDEEIDITKYVAYDFKQKIKYKIIGVCTHYGNSGSYGHYVAFCKNRENDTWYEFNDSFCSECNKREIYRGSPYLLLYERVFN